MDSTRFLTPIGSETAGVEPSMAPPVERPRASAPPHRAGFAANVVPLAVATALFMEFIDSTALSTALPTLAHAFHSDPIHLKLALTSYLLALAVFAPASGWVADRFGAKKVFLSAMAVFLVGSALCGLSRTLGALIAFRIVQGVGGAMMTPVGRLIVVGSAPRDRFVSAMSWFTMPALVGPLLGPPLSGLILGFASWPWIFYINLPVGLLGMVAVSLLVPRIERPAAEPFDTGGFLGAALAIVALTAVFETLGVGLAPLPLELLAAGVGGCALVWFLRHARRVAHPVLRLKLIGDPAFGASMAGGTLVRLGLGATPLLMPLLLQVGFGWSPMKAGLLTISQSAGAMLFKPVAASLIRRTGYRNVLLFSAVGTALSTAAPAAFRADTPLAAIVIVLGVGGFLRSMHFTAANALAYADIDKGDVSSASTLSTVIQQISMSLGVSLGGLALHLARGTGALSPGRFVMPFIAMGVLALFAVVPYLRLAPDVGASIGGRPARAPA